MIYFKNNFVDIAKELIKTNDDFDTLNDLTQIENAKNNLHTLSGQIFAMELNNKLRIKYPVIDEMLIIADNFATIQTYNNNAKRCNSIVEENLLTQDEYGILCDKLIKSKIINRIEDFIDTVNND